jgi:ADP-ribose pyrophosphatase YjhB (NUDIX family)
MTNENLSSNHIKIWVGIMIKDWNKILLWHRCKNKKDTGWIHEVDTWCFPWWKQEYNETVIQAAIREVKEETNLDIENPKVFTALDDIATDRHFITIWVLCEKFNWELKCMEPGKEDERQRFDLDNLPENLYSPTKHLLDYYKNGQAN